MSTAVLEAPVRIRKQPAREKKTMSFEEFLQKLRVTTEWFEWRLESPFGLIRGRRLSGKKKKSIWRDCPVTAVAYLETDKEFGLGDWEVAARAIGLRITTARLIVDGADNRRSNNGEESSRGERCRKQLLAALNLTEVKQPKKQLPAALNLTEK